MNKISAAVALALCGCSGRAADVASPPLSVCAHEHHATEMPTKLPEDMLSSVGKPVTLTIRDATVFSDGLRVQIISLDAVLVPHGDLVDLNDPSSFSAKASAGAVHIPWQETDKINKVQRLVIGSEDGMLHLDGNLAGLGVPFKILGVPAVAEDGRLTLSVVKARALGIGVKPFLSAFSPEGDDKPSVVQVDKHMVYLDPFAGMPDIDVAFSRVKIEDGGMTAFVGEAPVAATEDSFVEISGGVIRSRGSLLFDTTLRLVPLEGEHLRIAAGGMAAQLQAGHTKQKPERVIEVHVGGQ